MSPLDYAMSYADAGLYVFPCIMVDKGGARPVKQPAIPAWQNDASTDGAQLAEWWGRWPGAMVGMAHRLTGSVALDIDVKPGADGWMTYLRHRLAGDDDPATLAFGTSSGGAQRVFLRPPALRELSGNFPGSLGAGLDAIYGYSVLPSGDATPGRTWVNGPHDLLPAPAPAWVTAPAMARADELAALAILPAVRPVWAGPAGDANSMAYVAAAADGEAAEVRALPAGQRQTGLHAAACNLGRACARAGRADMAGWCGDVLAGAAGWCGTSHERATIRRGIAWGLSVGGDA